MKTKTIVLILFFTQYFFCSAQEKNLKESVEEFVKEFKIKPSTSKIEKGKNPFAGKTIEIKGDWSVDRIYFVNDKYYIHFDFDSENNFRQNFLGTYKLIENGSLQVAVLLDDRDEIEGFVSRKNEKEFWVKKEDYSEIDICETLKANDAEREININNNEVDALNYSNPKVTLYTKNGKLGIKYQGKKILPTECDSLHIYGEMAGIYTTLKLNFIESCLRIIIDFFHKS